MDHHQTFAAVEHPRNQLATQSADEDPHFPDNAIPSVVLQIQHRQDDSGAPGQLLQYDSRQGYLPHSSFLVAPWVERCW